MIPHRQTLINMGWPQPKSPIQTDNSTAAGVTNKTIVPHRAKMMDMHLWWLPCRGSQEQFRYYWDAGSENWADYHTKHQLDTYHKAHQITHAGIWDAPGASTGHHSCLTIGPWVSLPRRFSLFIFYFSQLFC
jgi:hypothetical protein